MRFRLRTLLIVLALGPPWLVGLYVLSMGPAHWLVDHGLFKSDVYFAMYDRVLDAAYRDWSYGDGRFHRVLDWYVSLWGDTIGV
jgi:hypothetical protein